MSLEEDIKAVVTSQGLELYDTLLTSRGGETIFEVMLMGKNGVSLEQCAYISHLLSPLLDVTPPVKDEYRLEVGTPGIERKLKTLEHFTHSVGELVKVTLTDKTVYEGKLISVEGTTITLEDKAQGLKSFSFSEVVKARTYFEW